MRDKLDRLAADLKLDSPEREPLRLRFGLACARRVAHLLESEDMRACLDGLESYLKGEMSRDALNALAARAAKLAGAHPGSLSLDGCGHAAVSASYAAARALAGQARQAAEYAAYAAVYGQGGYGAAMEPESFEPEFEWQAACLAELARAMKIG
ncbi:hypothetical protein ACFFU8_19550 [Chromobacterium piscinae]|uniref:hypothetical protein n=1 Tax=Chromobacterium piscinae TaxID=686831 RepID=UPI00140DB93A|nr:hypothetical protein [Chromobacterium piscinae]MBX9347375.1 hypothetical protein [Chromobacterium vaccinii]MCD4505719.1 hypothetical protein [Chromobacterium piscinae]MCD5328052.1 hypothetical protein [Chromobacterium piscinae]NHQ80669.1 hypothetical protein [Chromobacterium vaccinii]